MQILNTFTIIQSNSSHKQPLKITLNTFTIIQSNSSHKQPLKIRCYTQWNLFLSFKTLFAYEGAIPISWTELSFIFQAIIMEYSISRFPMHIGGLQDNFYFH